MPRSVRLPLFSPCFRFASAKATRFSNVGRKEWSSSESRASQNLSTKAARSASVVAAAHAAFSPSDISHCTGPSPHAGLAGSRASAGGWNSA